MTLLTTLIAVLKTRLDLRDDERGGFEIASGMAIAAFAIVAAGLIFVALQAAGVDIVNAMRDTIMADLDQGQP